MIALKALDDNFTIYQVNERSEIPADIYSSGFWSLTKTDDELSVVTNCPTIFNHLKVSTAWKGFKVDGILNFSLVGIVHDIVKPLKDNGISVFVISTYNTDYVFVNEDVFQLSQDIFRATEGITLTD